jgi:hypothetical protein
MPSGEEARERGERSEARCARVKVMNVKLTLTAGWGARVSRMVARRASCLVGRPGFSGGGGGGE